MEATTAAAPAPYTPTEVAQRRWIRWNLYLGFVGLGLGLLMGVLQALDRMEIFLYDDVGLSSYYQGLTLHGVAMVFVLTFSFANAFLLSATSRGFERPLASTALTAASFISAATGVVLAAAAILLNQATVLYTFYSPLQGSTIFYLGAVLLVVSTWLVLANMLWTLRRWRKDHPGEKSPLLAYVSIMTYIMWTLSSVGVAVQVVVFLIPWSLGWIDGTDPLLNRTLFWFTGHPIVYFWLLPAYVSWYMCIPKQVEGRLYSDAVVRGVFILFLLFSIPVGLHHQYTDPGVDQGLKILHGAFTFAVFFPSVVTAFTLIAALEDGAKKRGGRGFVMWIRRLPWANPSVTAQLLAMLGFVLGGVSGLVNASVTVNLVVHNTSFIPGHFHLTVGTAVALSIMGICYWYLPYITGRELWGKRLAQIQPWLWFGGVLIFSRGLMAAGIEGQPRRVPVSLGAQNYFEESWKVFDYMTGIGGSIMFISGVLFLVVMIGTLLRDEKSVEGRVAFPLSNIIHGPKNSPAWLDNYMLWTIVAIVLIAIAYVPVFLNHEYGFTSPPLIRW